MTAQKAGYAQGDQPRRLDQVIEGADLFLGLSGPGVLTPAMVAKMAPRPIIFALANPNPEIMPDAARAVSPDAIIATGRSDFPNQVNNVLCFPFIFRGALDVGATQINDAMQLACIDGIAQLARATTSAEAAAAYQGEPAPDGGGCPCGCQGRDGDRRGDAAPGRSGGLSPQAGWVGLPVCPDHAPDFRGLGHGGAAHRLCGRRG
jgi:hypothetical protein